MTCQPGSNIPSASGCFSEANRHSSTSSSSLESSFNSSTNVDVDVVKGHRNDIQHALLPLP